MTNTILGLIPARGGSKGIPNKNIIDLNGKPLITYSIEAAKNSTLLSHTIVSTDSQNIADIALQAGAEIPFMRPSTLATDSSGAVGVVQHAFEHYESVGQTIDFIVYLQPTSPLRSSEDIDAAIDIMLNANADSLVSVMDVPHQYGIDSLMTETTDSREKWVTPLTNNSTFRRQEKTHYVARNGPAIVITKSKTIKDFNNLYGNKIASYKMPDNRSADIDSSHDLNYVAWLLEKQLLQEK